MNGCRNKKTFLFKNFIFLAAVIFRIITNRDKNYFSVFYSVTKRTILFSMGNSFDYGFSRLCFEHRFASKCFFFFTKVIQSILDIHATPISPRISSAFSIFKPYSVYRERGTIYEKILRFACKFPTNY